jgi:hypothetical protein
VTCMPNALASYVVIITGFYSLCSHQGSSILVPTLAATTG